MIDVRCFDVRWLVFVVGWVLVCDYCLWLVVCYFVFVFAVCYVVVRYACFARRVLFVVCRLLLIFWL